MSDGPAWRWPRLPGRRRAFFFSIILGAAGTAAAILIHRRGEPLVDAVISSAHQPRPIEARLTALHAWAPLPTVQRGGTQGPSRLELVGARNRAAEIARNAPTAEAWRATGLGDLLLGNSNAAAKALEQGTKAFAADARLWSDLAVARYAQFLDSGSATRLTAAFAAASSALRLSPGLPEAQFNLALILQQLGFRGASARACKRYLDLDGYSPWAEEARSRFESASVRPLSERWPLEKEALRLAAREERVEDVERIVERFPVFTRDLLLDETLPAWADASPREGRGLLDEARELARAWRSQTGDPLLLESVDVIERASRSPSEDRLVRLQQAHRLYADAHRRQAEDQAKARSALERAMHLFDRAGSPLRWSAAFDLASYQFDSNDLPAAIETLQPISRIARDRYPYLYARSQWLIGLIEICRGHAADSLDAYHEALDTFRRTGNRGGESAIRGLLAEVYQEAGEAERAANEMRASLSGLENVEQPLRRYLALSVAGEMAQDSGQIDLAREAYLDAAQAAQETGRPETHVYVLILLARIEHAAGNPIAARARLADAADFNASIPDPGLRERSAAEIQMARGEIAARRAEAMDALTSAERFFVARGDLGRLEALYQIRGNLYLAAGDSTRARRDFLAGVEAAERERQQLPSNESMRIAIFERSKGLFRDAVALLSEQGDLERAADVLELARARTLFERASREAAPRPETAAILSSRLPPRTAVLEYAALPGKLLTFVYRSGGVRMICGTSTLARVSDLAAASANRSPGSESAAALARSELYHELIAPVGSLLDGVDTLVFVPDEAMHAVPFAGLRSASGRYLVEDYRVCVAPSLRMFVLASERLRSLENGPPGPVLVVANPRPASRLASRLPALPGAAREAILVAGSQRSSITLEDGTATKAHFLEQARRARIIHFAGHTLFDGKAAASLVFAPEPGAEDLGLLHADEIAALDLPRARLVVLSACDTARGPARGAEGVMSVARAFLAAGVPAVLGSLAPVEDRASAALLSDFHRSLAAGSDALTALRNAQRQALASDDPAARDPSSWAAFELIGATKGECCEEGGGHERQPNHHL